MSQEFTDCVPVGSLLLGGSWGWGVDMRVPGNRRPTLYSLRLLSLALLYTHVSMSMRSILQRKVVDIEGQARSESFRAEDAVRLGWRGYLYKSEAARVLEVTLSAGAPWTFILQDLKTDEVWLYGHWEDPATYLTEADMSADTQSLLRSWMAQVATELGDLLDGADETHEALPDSVLPYGRSWPEEAPF